MLFRSGRNNYSPEEQTEFNRLNKNYDLASREVNTFNASAKTSVAGAFLFTTAAGVISPKWATFKKFETDLSNFVKEHGLGTVHVIPEFYNPNSHNMVRTTVWGLDLKAYTVFMQTYYDSLYPN